MGAFTSLGDRFGPYQPGASDLADLLRSKGGSTNRRGGRKGRQGGDYDRSEVEEAMTQVVEAFRFLHARVSTLEARAGTEDVPLDGAAWLAPARELHDWVEPIVSLVSAKAAEGDVVHADCGEGGLLLALAQSNANAIGVEPRGGVALRALENGCDVTISELGEYLAERPTESLGALVLSGVVDRVPLHTLVHLLAECRRVLLPGALIVIVSEPPTATADQPPTAQDMVDRAALHLETWELLLGRSGFIHVTHLAGVAGDARFGISAATPTT